MLQHLGDGTFHHHLATEPAGARPQVDQVIGGANGVLVVLDHDDRVPQVAKLLERTEQPLVVALVQSDAGLVQDVEDTHQAGADLSREADPLGLAA